MGIIHGNGLHQPHSNAGYQPASEQTVDNLLTAVANNLFPMPETKPTGLRDFSRPRAHPRLPVSMDYVDDGLGAVGTGDLRAVTRLRLNGPSGDEVAVITQTHREPSGARGTEHHRIVHATSGRLVVQQQVGTDSQLQPLWGPPLPEVAAQGLLASVTHLRPRTVHDQHNRLSA
jgi:hypothetical protein